MLCQSIIVNEPATTAMQMSNTMLCQEKVMAVLATEAANVKDIRTTDYTDIADKRKETRDESLHSH